MDECSTRTVMAPQSEALAFSNKSSAARVLFRTECISVRVLINASTSHGAADEGGKLGYHHEMRFHVGLSQATRRCALLSRKSSVRGES